MESKTPGENILLLGIFPQKATLKNMCITYITDEPMSYTYTIESNPYISPQEGKAFLARIEK